MGTFACIAASHARPLAPYRLPYSHDQRMLLIRDLEKRGQDVLLQCFEKLDKAADATVVSKSVNRRVIAIIIQTRLTK